eukprot:3595268-Rhodomonas_salina.1
MVRWASILNLDFLVLPGARTPHRLRARLSHRVPLLPCFRCPRHCVVGGAMWWVVPALRRARLSQAER